MARLFNWLFAEQIAAYEARIAALEAWKGQVEAAWPEIQEGN